MTNAKQALDSLNEDLKKERHIEPVQFGSFLDLTKEKPTLVLRNIFQLFYDMMHYYVPKGTPHDLEKRGFIRYDCSKLFIDGVDEPFFADRLFSSRLMDLVNGFKKGLQSNRIILFEGPPGSGKSLFLNNLMDKLEQFTKTPEGIMYETLWRLDINKLGGFSHFPDDRFKKGKGLKDGSAYITPPENHLDVPCPNHDHPILQIPKTHRKKFLEELIEDEEFRGKLFDKKEYEWILKAKACSICTSIYNKLLEKLKNPEQVFQMLYAQQYKFSRQLGEGVSVFNAEDLVSNKPHTNKFLQDMLSNLLRGGKAVKYIFSDFAKTNNGVYALMDIKESNRKRLNDLYGVATDEVHKVELVEEKVNSIFIGLINPEDTKSYKELPSFKDRITTVKFPYVLDYNTEIDIYKSKFSGDLESLFLPRVLKNFTRVIISSRLDPKSGVLREWIDKPEQYEFLDKNLLLLKIELFTENLPDWLSEEDRKKRSKSELRKKLNVESESEGLKGFSGRRSIEILNTFLARYARLSKPITMNMLETFWSDRQLRRMVPERFLEALVRKYDFDVLEEVKESLYHYNKDQISRDVQNYLYCINFAPDRTEKCVYTGDEIEITDRYFEDIEGILLGWGSGDYERVDFRNDMQKTYVSKTLATEMKVEGKTLTETEQYKFLFNKYLQNVKENVLAPLVENGNFRRAIQDYGTASFSSHDKKLRQDVSLLMQNLHKKFSYTEAGAKQVCIYVLDKNLAEQF